MTALRSAVAWPKPHYFSFHWVVVSHHTRDDREWLFTFPFLPFPFPIVALISVIIVCTVANNFKFFKVRANNFGMSDYYRLLPLVGVGGLLPLYNKLYVLHIFHISQFVCRPTRAPHATDPDITLHQIPMAAWNLFHGNKGHSHSHTG